MSNDGWGSKWPSVTLPQAQVGVEITIENRTDKPLTIWPSGFVLQSGEKVYSNVKPTHDPYSNPNAQVYYQCDCGAILDPGTKSFAELNNCASREGWKVRWNKNGSGYQPFCVECGKDVPE